MQASSEIRKKLAMLIGGIVSRSIDDARLIPHVLTQEEVVGILVHDPATFERLLHDDDANQFDRDMTVKLDAFMELSKIESLDEFENSSWQASEAEIAPILELTNQLMRTFAVYLGNASTLFDKRFEDFMAKFRRSLSRAGMTIRAVDFTIEDVGILDEIAKAHLRAGDLMQAFTFDRLISSQIMIKQVVNLPAQGFSLKENLIQAGLGSPDLFLKLSRFLLRMCYISQGAWEDLFPVLVRMVFREEGLCTLAQLTDLIERDVVFSCNLLCGSYSELRVWSPARRRSAIENSLQKYG